MKLKKIINLFGGPSVGKSLIALELTALMKKKGCNVELVPEYAKELTFEERFNILEQDQIYIFAKQHRRILRLKDQVEYIVTDSPILLSVIYASINLKNMFDVKMFQDLVLNINNNYNNMNVLLERNCEYKYKQEGRYQTEEQAKIVDDLLKYKINRFYTNLYELKSDDETTSKIMRILNI